MHRQTIKQHNTMRQTAKKLTVNELRNDSASSYNAMEWNKRIDRLLSIDSNVQFFKFEPSEIYSYPRFYSLYTCPDGLILLNSFDYSSTLSNTGFTPVLVTDYILDSKNSIIDLPEGQFDIELFGTTLNNSPEARQHMIKCSKEFGTIYTKESF